MLRNIARPSLRVSATRALNSPLATRAAVGRSSSTGLPRFSPALESKPTDVSVAKGSEGRHRKDLVAQNKEALTVPDAVIYTASELQAVQVMHRDAKSIGDKVAFGLVRLARRCFDIVSGYKHKAIPANSNMTVEELQKGGYILTEQGWLNRILFLESIAGVPGMVAATLRHLRSIRLMKRDAGWIHTLLEEAENERMHLMTFMTIRNPSIFFRALVLGAQGVFYNAFFLSYLISPTICHRFVAYLEEEAVLTYTRCIEEIEAGRVPGWESAPAPAIAKDYWRLKDDATLLDVIYAVRSDETTHRFVNHSLANLNYKTDINPFALREPDMHVKGVKLGFERDEAEKYVEHSHEILDKGSPSPK